MWLSWRDKKGKEAIGLDKGIGEENHGGNGVSIPVVFLFFLNPQYFYIQFSSEN